MNGTKSNDEASRETNNSDLEGFWLLLTELVNE